MHSWKGDGIDPNYKGSCAYRYYNLWLSKYKSETEIVFEGAKDDVVRMEGEIIDSYLRNIGSFLRNLPGRSHLLKYKSGRCLNASCPAVFNLNAETHARGVRTRRSYQKEIIKKSFESIDRSKSNKKAWKTLDLLGKKEERMRLLHCKEARVKAVNTRKLRGDLFYSEESVRKMIKTRLLKARRVMLEDGFEGCVSEVIEYKGWKKGSVCAKFTEAFRKGESYLFGERLLAIK